MKKRLYDDLIESDSLVNLTPLIDVVFVVLITFILIAPMLKLDRIELSLAGEQKKAPHSFQSKDAIVISVYMDNTITINQRQVTEKDLLPILISLKKNYPQEIPKLLHDKKAQFGTYQMIKNAIESAGFEELDIILKP